MERKIIDPESYSDSKYVHKDEASTVICMTSSPSLDVSVTVPHTYDYGTEVQTVCKIRATIV